MRLLGTTVEPMATSIPVVEGGLASKVSTKAVPLEVTSLVSSSCPPSTPIKPDALRTMVEATPATLKKATKSAAKLPEAAASVAQIPPAATSLLPSYFELVVSMDDWSTEFRPWDSSTGHALDSEILSGTSDATLAEGSGGPKGLLATGVTGTLSLGVPAGETSPSGADRIHDQAIWDLMTLMPQRWEGRERS